MMLGLDFIFILKKGTFALPYGNHQRKWVKYIFPRLISACSKFVFKSPCCQHLTKKTLLDKTW